MLIAAIDQIDREHIELDRGWLALLHYHQPLVGRGWKSDADAATFFLSANGKRDPRAEIAANVEAFFFAAERDRLRCVFPARYEWLRKRLSLAAGEDDVVHSCTALGDWYRSLAADAVSINFASSYLESPSSLFGHTFLRFDTPDTPELLTPTINYAADSSRQRSDIGFIVKGVIGGFPGIADQLPYFRRLRIYGDDEGRAIWEYPLALNAAQIRRMLLHLWEIKDGVFDYYFLDENCSYRTLALIAAARPELDLLQRFHGDVVPVETIRVLRDKGLIGRATFWPSAPRTLSWRTRDFTTAMLRATIDIARGLRTPSDLNAWPPEQQARILAAAAEYFAILVNRDQVDFAVRERVMPELLRARLSLDMPQPLDPVPQPPSPLATHNGHVLSIGAVDRQGQLGAEIGYEGFRHTLIDPLAGYDPGAEIRILGGQLRDTEGGHVDVEHLDVLEVKSQTSSTLLFPKSAWTLHLGADRKDINDNRRLVGTFGYANGRAVDLGVGVLALTLGADIDGGSALRGEIGLEGAIRVELTRQRAHFSVNAWAEFAKYLLGESSARHTYGVRFGVPLARDLSIDLDLQRAGAIHEESQALISLQRFF